MKGSSVFSHVDRDLCGLVQPDDHNHHGNQTGHPPRRQPKPLPAGAPRLTLLPEWAGYALQPAVPPPPQRQPELQAEPRVPVLVLVLAPASARPVEPAFPDRPSLVVGRLPLRRSRRSSRTLLYL